MWNLPLALLAFSCFQLATPLMPQKKKTSCVALVPSGQTRFKEQINRIQSGVTGIQEGDHLPP